MKPTSEFDALVDALRSDLPTEQDRARLRTKLSALGIAAAGTSLSGAAAAGIASAKGGATAVGIANAQGGAAAVGIAGAKGGAAVCATQAAMHATTWSLAAKVSVVAAVSVSVATAPAWYVSSQNATQQASATTPPGTNVSPRRPHLDKRQLADRNGSFATTDSQGVPTAAQQDNHDPPSARTTDNFKPSEARPASGALVPSSRSSLTNKALGEGRPQPASAAPIAATPNRVAPRAAAPAWETALPHGAGRGWETAPRIASASAWDESLPSSANGVRVPLDFHHVVAAPDDPSPPSLRTTPAPAMDSRSETNAPVFEPSPEGTGVRGTTLSEETRLIDGALSALRAGNHEAAALFLAEHARRFPMGLLYRERMHTRRKLDELQQRRTIP